MTLFTPIIGTELTDDRGSATITFQNYLTEVSRLSVLSGIGSPEGVVEAYPKRLYMDENGTSGNILYIKRDPDIGGDTSKGWILI